MSEVSLLIRKQEKKMTEVLVKKTHFTHVEVERLFQIYRLSLNSILMCEHFPRDNAIKLDAMDRNTFREFLHDAFNMTDDILMDRIFKFFDTKSDGTITREEWILGLNVLLKGTTEEQTTYSFSIYDLNHDGFISKYREKLFNL